MLMRDALARLTGYWTARGCRLVPPVDGGLDPAMLLRVLDPEPWRAVGVEPPERPGGPRAHTRLRVIRKPEPGDPQELYLDSLAAFGIDVAARDVRFVADDWAAPALGTWGSGWEVRLDGLSVGRVTLLRRVSGVRLEVLPVEITYGVERLVTALDDMPRLPEVERGYGERAEPDAGEAVRLIDRYAAEAQRLVGAGQPAAAYACLRRCSHALGALSGIDRAAGAARIRRLAGEAARLWAAHRAEPDRPPAADRPSHRPPGAAEPRHRPPGAAEPRRPLVAPPGRSAGPTGPHTLIFEIGTGELPPAEARAAREGVRRELAEGLAATRFRHGEVRVFGTPRRLVAMVGEVGGGAPDELAGVLARVVTARRGARTMRWSGPEARSGRPIRWLTALWGDDVVPVTVLGVAAGRGTRALRAAAGPELTVDSAETFMETLALAGVVADPEDRHDLIVTGAQDMVYPDGRVDVRAEAALLDRLAWLVEAPTPLLGTFDESFLALPQPLLTSVLRRQHCLPVRDADGALLPMFVAVADGPVDVELVRDGNEAVLRARLEEAAFLHRADLAAAPAGLRARLSGVAFGEALGTMADRADRIAALASALAAPLGLSSPTLDRAAALVKFHLGARLASEMPDLGGLLAGDHARHAGEPAAVAEALREAELPRRTGDDLPRSVPGALLSLADRLDLVTGLAATVGLPTGSGDPFAVRRAVLGLIAVHRAQPALSGLSLADALAVAAATQPVPVPEHLPAAVLDFLARRLARVLVAEGHPAGRVRAVLPHAARPALVDTLLSQLTQVDLGATAVALRRAGRIVPPGTPPAYDPAALTHPADLALHEAVGAARADLAGRPAPDLLRFAAATGPLAGLVGRFFAEVRVLTDEPAVRAARLGLLATVSDVGAGVLDWAALGGRARC